MFKSIRHMIFWEKAVLCISNLYYIFYTKLKCFVRNIQILLELFLNYTFMPISVFFLISYFIFWCNVNAFKIKKLTLTRTKIFVKVCAKCNITLYYIIKLDEATVIRQNNVCMCITYINKKLSNNIRPLSFPFEYFIRFTYYYYCY